MRVLLDTAFLLNEFFCRHPAYAQVRGGAAAPDSLLQAWEQSHNALQALAQMPVGAVFVPEYVLMRLVAVLSELGVPKAAVAEEVHAWLHNATLLPLSMPALEDLLAEDSPAQASAEELALVQLASKHGLAAILSPVPRLAPHPLAAHFITPQEVITSASHP